MGRKLASVQQIKDLRPIPGADKIEVAIINNWEVVVNKGQFKKGDLCVYFEIDSFLPIKEEYEFLRSSSYKKLDNGEEGFRLRTVRLKGQLSQGLALPIKERWTLGYDLTDILGVKKYEPTIPANLVGKIKQAFPTHLIPKTEGERIQNLTNEFESYRTLKWRVTEKLDGTSATYYWYEGHFGVCSRNYELEDTPGCVYWEMARQYDIHQLLSRLNKNIAIQGEIIGEKIQGNPYNIKGKQLRVFWLYDIDKQSIIFLDYLDEFFKNDSYGLFQLDSVPVLSNDILLPSSIDYLLDVAQGKSILNSNTEREGLFFNCLSDPNIKFKAISNKFLLNQFDIYYKKSLRL